jgi:hypothetical protein
MSHEPQPLFREEQSFPQLRLRIMLAIPPSFMLILIVWQVVLRHTWGTHPMSNAGVVTWTVILWLLYFYLIRVRLVTTVSTGEMVISLRGLWRGRRISLAEIKSVNVVTYNPTRDYGGYGIRTTRGGKAYIARGNEAVRLELASGAAVLLGSHRPKDLAAAIRSLTR